VWAKNVTRESHLLSQDYRRMWGNEPTHSQVGSNIGNWSLNGLSNFQRTISRVKYHWIKKFLIPLKISWNEDVKNQLAWLIWIIKTQVIAKKNGWVSKCQFDFWSLKIKNRLDLLVHTWRVTYCWKALDKGYNFYFNFTPIGGLQKMIWAFQVAKVLILKISRLPTWELGIKWNMGAALWLIIDNIIRGKPPSLGRGESCESVYVRGSSVHQKCSNYAITNLLFSLCRSMWIVDSLVIRSNLHPKAIACLSYPPPRFQAWGWKSM
jgi:hypothetical protein